MWAVSCPSSQIALIIYDTCTYTFHQVVREEVLMAMDEFSVKVATCLVKHLSHMATNLPVVGPVATLLGDVFIVIENVNATEMYVLRATQ